MLNAKRTITKSIAGAIVKTCPDLDEEIEVVVQPADDPEHGDYASPVALQLAKQLKKNPMEVAEEIVAKLPENKMIKKVEVAAPGFINFFLAREYFAELVSGITEAGDDWGKTDVFAGKKVMVEYSQPNPFKPFHIGHVMATTVGEAVSRLVEFGGADMRRANYQGDVGLHVAKALWGLRALGNDPSKIKDLGEAYVHGNRSYEEDEQAKAEIMEINEEVYDGGSGVKEHYETGRKVSLDHFEEIYMLLGTKFDYYFFEGETWESGKKLVEEGLEKGVFEESDGAIVFPGEKHGLHTRVFVTKKGIPTYEAKEFGLIEQKLGRFDADVILVEAAQEQATYFDVVFKAYELLRPEMKTSLEHVHHGLMKLKGGKMGSRTGNIITGESLINDMQEMVREVVADRDLGDEKESVVEAVAVAAIKYSILKQGMGRDIVFDPDSSLSFEGDSGPYLQYTQTRALSVLKKSEEDGVKADVSKPVSGTLEVERLLDRFPAVVEEAQREYAPHNVAVYLAELAGAFNSWYAKEKIVDVADEMSPYKVAVTRAVQITLKNGLWLLGMTAPEHM